MGELPTRLGWYRITRNDGESTIVKLLKDDRNIICGATLGGYVTRVGHDCIPEDYLYNCTWDEFLGTKWDDNFTNKANR